MSNLKELEKARYEVKFVTTEERLYLLLKWIRLHPARFKSSYNDRCINNIYFDTYNYFAYTENISGVSTRNKVRYRWYGESKFPDVGKLEVKCRRNVFGWKKVFPIKDLPDFDSSNILFSDFKDSLLQGLKGDRIWLDHNPHQVILNRYKRKYFISGDGKVRITVDTNLEIYDQRYKPHINVTSKANIPQTIIVEVKTDRENRELLSQVINGIPIRVSRNSKYVNAVTCLNTY
jgi:hypothetical protein